MSGQETVRTDQPTGDLTPVSAPARQVGEIAERADSPTDLCRLAELVAAGEFPLPGDLARDSLERLVRDVRRLRRERLVKHIARAIALDIHDDGQIQ